MPCSLRDAPNKCLREREIMLPIATWQLVPACSDDKVIFLRSVQKHLVYILTDSGEMERADVFSDSDNRFIFEEHIEYPVHKTHPSRHKISTRVTDVTGGVQNFANGTKHKFFSVFETYSKGRYQSPRTFLPRSATS